jgi:hypothetical protein
MFNGDFVMTSTLKIKQFLKSLIKHDGKCNLDNFRTIKCSCDNCIIHVRALELNKHDKFEHCICERAYEVAKILYTELYGETELMEELL